MDTVCLDTVCLAQPVPHDHCGRMGAPAAVPSAHPPSTTAARRRDPAMRYEYDTQVNKGDINMRSLASDLNARGGDGWRLAHVYSQGGNTILIYERAVD